MFLVWQVDCFSGLGCTYCDISIGQPSAFSLPKWGFHQVGWHLGYYENIVCFFFLSVSFGWWVTNRNLRSIFCFFTRSSGDHSLCILLLLPFTCSDCWGNDAWLEISLHNNPSNEVMNFVVFACFLSYYFAVFSERRWQADSAADYLLINLYYRCGATLMNSSLFNVGLILLCSIRLASSILNIFLYVLKLECVCVCLGGWWWFVRCETLKETMLKVQSAFFLHTL